MSDHQAIANNLGNSQILLDDVNMANVRNHLFSLRNFLKLPKARRWQICEFFYPDVDNQIFLSAESEFTECIKETFPSLKTRRLRRQEWQFIRRSIGKPRRFSEAFLVEERIALAQKRDKIRALYAGTLRSLTDEGNEELDLPQEIPNPITTGSRVVVRLQEPKEGLFAATVEMVSPDYKLYRVCFDKDLLPPQLVPDTQVCTAHVFQLWKVKDMILRNIRVFSGHMPLPERPRQIAAAGDDSHTPSAENKALRNFFFRVMTDKVPPGETITILDSLFTDYDRFGPHPTRLLFNLVKINKFLIGKKAYIAQLDELNRCAEHLCLLNHPYPVEFQQRYAEVLLNLETIDNRLTTELSQLTVLTSKNFENVDQNKKWSQGRAAHMTHHIANSMAVGLSASQLHLVANLVAMLLQISQGNDPSPEIQKEMMSTVDPRNRELVQDGAMVHLSHLRLLMRHFEGKRY